MNIVYIEYSIATKSLDIFISGCKLPLCEGCCNPELADHTIGTDWLDWTDKIDEYLTKYSGMIENIFLLGGSPNHQSTCQLNMFFEFFKDKFKTKKVWLFAREDLDHIQPIFLKKCAFIKCGAYIPELRCDNNISEGVKLATSNQKVYKRGKDY